MKNELLKTKIVIVAFFFCRNYTQEVILQIQVVCVLNFQIHIQNNQ